MRRSRQTGQGRHQSGLAAEEIAAHAYTSRGGRIVDRRWRCREGELDLVIAIDSLIAFVEVKLCRRATPDSPIRPRQWARIAAAASQWLAACPGMPAGCRFDAVIVDGMGRPRVIENAYVQGLT